jgi:alkanesulfonate monooxygenase SsuD/methylene tetrahydromethanopterin reductase-like flavin-dependent oxidoreductase (luciferase family)
VLRFLDRAWSGERVDVGPETGTTSFTVQGFRLGVVPPERPKVLLAALRGRMLRLAGTEADGVVINWLSAADVERVVPIVEEAADGAPREVVARIMVAPTADAEMARALGRRLITGYLTVPVYRDFHRWLGREELEPMWRHWEAGDRRAALDAVPDHVVDELVLHGAPEACREQVQAYAASGVDVPVMSLLPVGEDPLALCRALAPA